MPNFPYEHCNYCTENNHSRFFNSPNCYCDYAIKRSCDENWNDYYGEQKYNKDYPRDHWSAIYNFAHFLWQNKFTEIKNLPINVRKLKNKAQYVFMGAALECISLWLNATETYEACWDAVFYYFPEYKNGAWDKLAE